MIQFRDGPFIRPHPAFWRAVLGINVLYELVLVFLLFQDLDSARMMMTYVDPSLGHPLPEKSYAEDCALNWTTIYVGGRIRAISCRAHLIPSFFIECHRYILSCARIGMARQSPNPPRLLVLLGGSLL